jgi:hypothetical protein
MKIYIERLRWLKNCRLTDQYIDLVKTAGPFLEWLAAYIHGGLASAIGRLVHAYNDCFSSPMLTKTKRAIGAWHHTANISPYDCQCWCGNEPPTIDNPLRM